MLLKLVIKNYALIDEVEIDFSEGLSIITGQTGAGKSIMLGALGLLLGERADVKTIADHSRKTVVEAIFLLTAAGTGSDEQERIVRREISPSGRSRAFIDDSPVTLSELGETVGRLLDIHSQHANLSLNTRAGQLQIIDAMSGTEEKLAGYRNSFRKYVELRSKIKRIREIREHNKEKRGYLQMQLEGLKKLKPRKGEQREIEQRFEMLSEADEIRESLSGAHYLLAGDHDCAMALIKSAVERLECFNLQAVDPTPEDESLISRLQSIYIELKDIAYTAEQLADNIESNPSLLAKIGARMKAYYEAVKVMGVDNGDELVDLQDDLERQLHLIDGDDEESKEYEAEARALAKKLKETAAEISFLRRKGADYFSTELIRIAKPLGLANLNFKVKIDEGKLTSDGQDTVEFVCSFNKNGALMPMANTASGGELSRLTLSIKSMMAEKMSMPTVIFDEIDTGVSGEIADKMGRMMVEMADRMQILTITHLPQVAAKGKRHYKVFKQDTAERTISSVKELMGEEKVYEIAGMLSGERVTDAALEAARILIEGQNGEN